MNTEAVFDGEEEVMKAAVLDGYTLNPGDLSWKILQDIADITIYDKTAPDEVYERVKDCEAVLSNKVVFSKELIARYLSCDISACLQPAIMLLM